MLVARSRLISQQRRRGRLFHQASCPQFPTGTAIQINFPEINTDLFSLTFLKRSVHILYVCIHSGAFRNSVTTSETGMCGHKSHQQAPAADVGQSVNIVLAAKPPKAEN